MYIRLDIQLRQERFEWNETGGEMNGPVRTVLPVGVCLCGLITTYCHQDFTTKMSAFFRQKRWYLSTELHLGAGIATY